MGQEELGERWLLSALHEDPSYQPAHAALADFYEKKGNQEDAAFHRQRAQELRAEGKKPKAASSGPRREDSKQ
jgi:Tfp pilus assembly protein PilF